MYNFFLQNLYFLCLILIIWYLSVSSVYRSRNYSSSMLLFLTIQTSGDLLDGNTHNAHIKLDRGTAVGLILLCLGQKTQQWWKWVAGDFLFPNTGNTKTHRGQSIQSCRQDLIKKLPFSRVQKMQRPAPFPAPEWYTLDQLFVLGRHSSVTSAGRGDQ